MLTPSWATLTLKLDMGESKEAEIDSAATDLAWLCNIEQLLQGYEGGS